MPGAPGIEDLQLKHGVGDMLCNGYVTAAQQLVHFRSNLKFQTQQQPPICDF